MEEVPADLVVADIGNFFQDQLFAFRLRELLDHASGSRIVQKMIPDAQALLQDRLAELSDLLLIKMECHQYTVFIEEASELDDLALNIEPPRLNDVEGLVQNDFLSFA